MVFRGMFSDLAIGKNNKNKNKQMELHQTKKNAWGNFWIKLEVTWVKTE